MPQPIQVPPVGLPADFPLPAGVQVPASSVPQAVKQAVTQAAKPEAPADEVVSAEDKVRYLQALQARTRLNKEYPLYRGYVRVVFRELSPSEEDMILRQLETDVALGVCRSAELYRRLWADYRLVASLERVCNGDENPQPLPPVSSMASEDPSMTPLPQLRAWVFANWLPVESIRNAAYVAYQKFDRMLLELAAASGDPDFFCETPSSAS